MNVCYRIVALAREAEDILGEPWVLEGEALKYVEIYQKALKRRWILVLTHFLNEIKQEE
jgi:hypothetical protein